MSSHSEVAGEGYEKTEQGGRVRQAGDSGAGQLDSKEPITRAPWKETFSQGSARTWGEPCAYLQEAFQAELTAMVRMLRQSTSGVLDERQEGWCGWSVMHERI